GHKGRQGVGQDGTGDRPESDLAGRRPGLDRHVHGQAESRDAVHVGQAEAQGGHGAGHEARLDVLDVRREERSSRGMGQERFADIVERFTNGYTDGVGVSDESVRQWQEELDRTLRRFRNLGDMVSNPIEPRTGGTPREGGYRPDKSPRHPYQAPPTHPPPVLFVPNLGISRPYIFDLLPGGSFVEHMTREGFDFYLLDWGVFGPEDNGLTLEECVVKILPRMARKVLETSGTDELSVLGYCM